MFSHPRKCFTALALAPAFVLIVLAAAAGCRSTRGPLPAGTDASGTSGTGGGGNGGGPVGGGGSGGVRGGGGSSGTGGAPTGGSSPTGGIGGPGATGGAGGSVGSDAGAGGTGGGGAAADAGRDAGPSCNCGAFEDYHSCCGDRCLNLHNDPQNCGMCGNRCPADKPFCGGGVCGPPPCDGVTCSSGFCCGRGCCQPNQICCSVEGPISASLGCHTPTPDQPTCPKGCAPLCISDRAVKRAVEPVNTQDVLAKVGELPISTWRYLSEAPGVRHMGPMAQDFRRAFGLGDSD